MVEELLQFLLQNQALFIVLGITFVALLVLLELESIRFHHTQTLLERWEEFKNNYSIVTKSPITSLRKTEGVYYFPVYSSSKRFQPLKYGVSGVKISGKVYWASSCIPQRGSAYVEPCKVDYKSYSKDKIPEIQAIIKGGPFCIR